MTDDTIRDADRASADVIFEVLTEHARTCAGPVTGTLPVLGTVTVIYHRGERRWSLRSAHTRLATRWTLPSLRAYVRDRVDAAHRAGGSSAIAGSLPQPDPDMVPHPAIVQLRAGRDAALDLIEDLGLALVQIRMSDGCREPVRGMFALLDREEIRRGSYHDRLDEWCRIIFDAEWYATVA